ncbi:MAG: aminotransferase class V-fold PLP-dependent enzyme, partial [Promethearchaeota archaeon]
RLLKKGEILYPTGEFPSSIHIFKSLGFKTKKIEVQQDNSYSLLDIEKKVTSDSKYLIHSHVQYLTGFRQDLDELGKLCKKFNIMNLINATQSFGAFPLDVKNQNIDMLVASGLKWACSGYGIGILYINDKHIINADLPFSSWLSVSNAFSMNNENMNIIKKTRSLDGLGGTPNFPALMAFKGGLSLIKDIGKGNIKDGVENIKNRIIFLSSEFINQIQNLDLKIISPITLKNRSGIVSIENERAEMIYNKLLSNNIYISLRNYPGSRKKNLLRFAFNYYNNLDDITKVIKILGEFK